MRFVRPSARAPAGTGTKDSRKGMAGSLGSGSSPGPRRLCSSGPLCGLVRDGRMFVSRPVCFPRPGPIFSSEKPLG